MPEGFVIWLTGLPSSGKTTIALALAASSARDGAAVEVLDGDEIRRTLSADLGFSPEDRREQGRRVAWVAKLLARNGITVIVPLISPYAESRQFARREIKRFLEVYVRCPVAECIRRDEKGLYARAIRGEIQDFTGISAPYEPPGCPEVTVDTDLLSVDQCCRLILDKVSQLGFTITSQVIGRAEIEARCRNRCQPRRTHQQL